MKHEAHARPADGRVVGRQRLALVEWATYPQSEEASELSWLEVCESLQDIAARDGRVLVLPSVVTVCVARDVVKEQWVTSVFAVPMAPGPTAQREVTV